MGKLDKNVEAWATRASTPDTPAVDSELKKYASPAQSQAIDAINEHGEGAAEFLGITRDALRTRMRRLKTHAARKGYQPHGPITPVAEGYAVKGTSSLIGADGEVKLRWVKTDRDQADRMQCLFEAMKDALAPLPLDGHERATAVVDSPRDLCEPVLFGLDRGHHESWGVSDPMDGRAGVFWRQHHSLSVVTEIPPVEVQVCSPSDYARDAHT